MEDLSALLTGAKMARVESAVTLELDCAIRITTDRLGGGNQRSEAVRKLLAAGVAADPELTRLALDMAARIRTGRAE